MLAVLEEGTRRLSHVMLETLPEQPHTPRHFPGQRRLLAEALGMLIEAQSQP
jgi:hypothetical protein